MSSKKKKRSKGRKEFRFVRCPNCRSWHSSFGYWGAAIDCSHCRVLFRPSTGEIISRPTP